MRVYSDKGYSLLDTLPLRQISCAQHATASAKAVYDTLNAKARLRGSAVTGFNLPTEAQWERAARAGVAATCMWGDSWNEAEAHARGNCRGTAALAEAGMFQPNDWGFYDMIGNVSEWTCECEGSRYYDYGDAENPVVDPKTATSSFFYYIRGGDHSQTSWTYFTPGYRTSAYSYADGNALVGFRLCRTVGE